MVFQKYALFPHLNVFENVAFGLRIKGMPLSLIKDRVEDVLALVNMSHLKDRSPETLSGGQAQRVAIARALVNEPEVLLLDEPLSALDQKLREKMQLELKTLQSRLGLTFIYVTHDQEEALVLSDRIGVMNKGRLEQVSSPAELYSRPSTMFAAQFVGPMTSFEAEVLTGADEHCEFKFQNYHLRGKLRSPQVAGVSTWAMIRPEKLRVSRLGENSSVSQNQVVGTVCQTVFRGIQTEIAVMVGSGAEILRAYVYSDQHSPQIGEQVALSFSPEDTFLFSRQDSEKVAPH